MSMTPFPAELGVPLPSQFRNTNDPYRPKKPMYAHIPIAPDADTFGDLERAAGEEPKRKPLEEIAALLRALTYGEMMDLAEAIWLAKPEGEMTPEAMAPTLHAWSQGQK